MTRVLAPLGALALVATLAAGAAAQQQIAESTDDTFHWAGRIPAGAWIHVENLNGSIDVDSSTDAETDVRAEKSWRRGDPKDVRIVVMREGDDITVCALWHDDDSCDERGRHSHGDHNDRNDVSVHFTVHAARGVKVDAETVNGGVDVRGGTAEVHAETVNGRVNAATLHGPVEAGTVNGGVTVRMNQLAEGDEPLEFSTVNGSITVEVPADFNADVEMETVNGSLRSDFPLTVSGRLSPRHLRAKIGKGGRRVHFETVNGSIELRKLD